MSRVSRGLRITGRVIKLIFFCVIFAVIGLLLWRVFSSGDPDSMKTITPNDRLSAAYVAAEERGEELYLFRQGQNQITSGENNYGYFSVTECVFIPEANQLQLVFRYNTATLRHLQEDYGLAEVPGREEELFDVSISVATDLTPDNAEDNLGNDPASVQFTRIHPTRVVTDQKNLYNYRRMVFDLGEAGLDLSALLDSDLLLAVYADIYYNRDIRYEENAYGTLCLYDYISEKKPAELTRDDRKALDAYIEEKEKKQ